MTTSERPLLDKLGVRPGHKVLMYGFRDRALEAAMRERGAEVAVRPVAGRDLVFSDPMAWRLRRCRDLMKPDGAVWVVRRKGRDARPSETYVREAGLKAGLVDNKIASFSEELTAMRFVIRLRDR